jgi:hypothetical protein
MEEAIKANITKLEKERDQFAIAANQRVAFLNGSIDALKKLLAPKAEPAMIADSIGEQEVKT